MTAVVNAITISTCKPTEGEWFLIGAIDTVAYTTSEFMHSDIPFA